MNVPKLRFKEFTDEWQKIPLNLFTNIYGGYAFKSENLLNYKSKYQVIKMGNVNNNTLNLEKNPSYLNTISQKELPYLLEKNDIILTLTGTFGKKDFGYSYQIKNETNLLLNQRLAVFKITNSNYSANFLKYILLNNTFLNKFFRFSVGGTGNQANVSIQDIKSFKIPFPKLEEQEKIANLLATVDKKITNLESIITSLENQKKGLLQQIFSQKLRFKDKNGNNYPNWEEKLFSDIFSFLSTNSYSRTEMNEYHGTVKNIHYGDVLIKFNHIIDLSKHQLPYLINYNSLPKEILKEQLNKQLIKNGDIVIADTAEDYTAGKVCEVINVNDNLIVSGLHTMLCRPKPNLFSLGFLGYFMNSYTYHHQLLKLITGTKVYSIIKKEIIKTKILIPCLEEQTKIADFLSAFDRKLENQKAQLEHWKQIKKGLLQQMFV